MSPNKMQLTRVEFINHWAETGATSTRPHLSHEVQYMERIASLGAVMKPFRMSDLEGEQRYRVEVAQLVQAFDYFPEFPADSFESTWRALEIEMKPMFSPSTGKKGQPVHLNVTQCLWELAKGIPEALVKSAWAAAPERAFEFLYNRLVAGDSHNPEALSDAPHKNGQARGSTRETISDASWNALDLALSKKYPRGSGNDRDAARFLRLVMIQDEVDFTYDADEDRATTSVGKSTVSLSPREKAFFLLRGILYSFRNDRMHGSSMPATLSSHASLTSYAFPLFCFQVCYSILVQMWIANGRPVEASTDEVRAHMEETLESFRTAIGSKW